MRIYNCTSSYCDRVRFFQECMWLLLCGCGAGFSVQQHHIAKLPKLISEKEDVYKRFVIEDSIEGWSDAVGVLVSSYFKQKEIFPEYNGFKITFDYSKIRPLGSDLSYGGKAPGAEPIKNALIKIKSLLDEAINNKQKQLKPIQAYDIVMHSSDAVLSGGVRRSAAICLFSFDDEEMMKAKTGNWFNENPQRGRSNNSVVLKKDGLKKEQFNKIIKNIAEFGEPGYLLVNDYEHLLNPCAEISFFAYNNEGKSGWQSCNLSTINCGKVKTEEDFYEACRAASIIGTLQAGFTNTDYLGDISKQIIQKEALLGVSMTGMMDSPDICLNPEIQRKGANIVKETNKIIAKKININQAARTTCVKPEGTSSCVLGTSSGIHPHHANRYIRRVQANRLEDVYQFFKKSNPRACEESVWSSNDTDEVISFCITVQDGAKTKNKMSAVDLLKYVQSTQINWVQAGTNKELCVKDWLVHNVSNTISVKSEEWDIVRDFIYENRSDFCGITLLPVTGDKDYPQAPFTSIYNPDKMIKFYGDGAIFVSGLIEQALLLFEDNLWKASEYLLGVVNVKGSSKKEWVDRCKKFSGKYFNNDLKKLSYCMKDVYNYKLWTELNQEYKDVDWDSLYEEEDNTKLSQELACVGGACVI